LIVQFTDIIDRSLLTDPHAPLSNRFFHDRAVISAGVFGQKNVTHFNIAVVFKPHGPSKMSIRSNGIIEEASAGLEWATTGEVCIRLRNKSRTGPVSKRFLARWFEESEPSQIVALKSAGEVIRLSDRIVDPIDWDLLDSEGSVRLDWLGVIALDQNAALSEGSDFLHLPRFVVAPELGYEQLGSVQRGGIGQSFGRVFRQLRTLRCNFTRVKKDIIDLFYNRVGTAEPHWVVPYPEAVTKVPPIWATLAAPPSFTKRAENGWYWNCSLRWTEAY